jgi:hypothetical protein
MYNTCIYASCANKQAVTYVYIICQFSLSTALTGIGLSYNGRYEVSLNATSEAVKDQDSMDRIVRTYFADELEALMTQIN